MNAIVARGLGKQYGSIAALTDVSFTIEAGTIAALLGPNGAGKSTAINRMLDLLPGKGDCRFHGRKFTDMLRPSASVGALVDGNPLIRSWTPLQHVDSLGSALGIQPSRRREVLEIVDLGDAMTRPVRAMSLGMRQRLGIALALLDDPAVLILDEPSGGLDPIGVGWLFKFLRSFADEGGTVLVSSHLLAEVSEVADHVIFLRSGKLVWNGTTEGFKARSGPPPVRVKAPDLAALTRLVLVLGGQVRQEQQETLWIDGVLASAIGHAALANGIEIHELATESGDIRSAFAYAVGSEES